MRSYGQYCAIARSLDLVGDRWTLLIVRELWLRPGRFTDLRAALPGIAPNLLTQRLRAMRTTGLITKVREPAPIAATVYHLTPRGEGLIPVLRELLRWGAPLTAQQDDDIFRPHWLPGVLEMAFDSVRTTTPLTVLIALDGDGPVALVSACSEGVRVDRASAETTAQVSISGKPEEILAVIRGDRDPGSLATAGSSAALARLRQLIRERRAGRASPDSPAEPS